VNGSKLIAKEFGYFLKDIGGKYLSFEKEMHLHGS
jgi:hypothetical protein